MSRDGSLSSFPASVDQLAIKWPIGGDRINGQAADTRNDLERAGQWNHMFDACLNLEKFLQKISAGGGILSYSETGGIVQGPNLILAYELQTLPASGSQSAWIYTLTTPEIFGPNPFADWRFNISPSVYVNIVPSAYVKPAAANQGALSDFDYRPELLNVYQPHISIYPVSGRVYKLKVSCQAMHRSSQLIGELSENCGRPSTTDNLGSSWLRSGEYPAMGIGNTTYTVGGLGNLLYLCSEGDYNNSNSSTWDGNWGLALSSGMGNSNDQQVIFSPYSWKGDGVDVGDYMARTMLALRVSGDPNYVGGNMNMYAVVFGDEAMPGTNRPTIGRLVKFVNSYIFGINPADNLSLTAAAPASSVVSLGTFPLHLVNNDSLPSLKYRFKVQGTTISVEEAQNGVTYSTVLSVTDTTHTAGTVGMMVLPMNGTGTGERCRRLVFFSSLLYQVLSGESPCDVKAKILYSLVGPAGPTTQTL